MSDNRQHIDSVFMSGREYVTSRRWCELENIAPSTARLWLRRGEIPGAIQMPGYNGGYMVPAGTPKPHKRRGRPPGGSMTALEKQRIAERARWRMIYTREKRRREIERLEKPEKEKVHI